MSTDRGIDTHSYEGAVVPLGGGLTFEIGLYDSEQRKTSVAITGNCCGTELTDRQAVEIHAFLGNYLCDRTNKRETSHDA